MKVLPVPVAITPVSFRLELFDANDACDLSDGPRGQVFGPRSPDPVPETVPDW
jgi:hypothetical protein